MYLVCFIIRIYHYARSPERQRDTYVFGCVCFQMCMFKILCVSTALLLI